MTNLRHLLASALASCALAAAPAAAPASAAATLTSSLTSLATPRALTNLSWSFDGAAKGDWLTIRCSGSDTYFSWTYTDGSARGSQQYELFAAGGAASACASINVALYSGASGAVVAATADIPVAPMVQQVRLSMTSDESQMVVDFVSTGGGAQPACSFGESPALGSSARGAGEAYATIGLVAHAVLTGLKPATTYFYACTDGVVTSETYSFVNRPSSPTLRVAVWADFGVDDGFGLSQIASDVQAGAFDMILHAGDCESVVRSRVAAASSSSSPYPRSSLRSPRTISTLLSQGPTTSTPRTARTATCF